ncbi:MAG: amidohydrolase family protein [Gemmatimonadales bacterium]
MKRTRTWAAAAAAGVLLVPSRQMDVTVHEGTSMSVAASPDGRRLVIDLQGSLWTLPIAGGTARRITDEYNDARQPAWSPDGRTIAFQGYRDGGFDIWAVNPDGTGLRQLTSGPFDDREPAWSADGRLVAFSSDRSGNYDIWTLDIATGTLRQVTKDPGDDYMPSFGPDGEVAFIGTRGGRRGVQAIRPADGRERTVAGADPSADAPSWGPSGTIVYATATATASSLRAHAEDAERVLTGGENAFAFRAGWLSAEEIVYVSDGLIRRRRVAGGEPATIPFSATLAVTRAEYAPRTRDVSSGEPRRALGIVGPALSPDGGQVAFVALGDLWLMPVGGTPRRLTEDAALDAEPAWSPDGRFLAWSSDRAGGTLLDLWTLELATGTMRRLTTEPTSAMGAAWSPDGTRIAYLDVDGFWRASSVAVVEVASGTVTKIHDQFFGPGSPTWSPDGKRVLVAALRPYSSRFREGTNQLLSIAATGGDDRWITPVEHRSIDSRVGAGPAWSPDGTRLALVYEGALSLLPVTPDGTPLGPPRRQSNEIAFQPTWSADSRRILYQSNDALRLLDLESGSVTTVPVPLDYRPAGPTGQVLIHAGQLIDGTSPALRRNVDILITGNRIERVAAHAAHPAGVRVVDASGLTVMPGLIEYHSHLQNDLGSAAFRAYLAFGVTTVRSPGGTPYEAVEEREAIDAGTRPGPRLFVTGYLMEWNRVYYKMAVAVSSPAHLQWELERARALQFDMIKSYVRMPDLAQRQIAAFAHAAGIPAASHEIYPAALSGLDGTEHTTGTSRRGYSPKAATLQRSYGDVAALFGATGMAFTPTLALGGGGLRSLLVREPGLATDPRVKLYPDWLTGFMTRGFGPAFPLPPANSAGPGGDMTMNLMKAGALVVAGTDVPLAPALHGEILSYVLAGMTPAEALRTATVNPARALGLDAGVVAPGKLADLAIVAGNPLADITATTKVRYTVANGTVYPVEELIRP